MTLVHLLPRVIHRPLRHVWRVALGPIRGRMRLEQNDLAARVPFGPAAITPTPPPRIAVICHLFHDDLAAEFRNALDNLPTANLFLSTDSATKVEAIEQAFSRWGRGTVTVRVMPNRGRDIAPKLVGFADVYAHHDLILFLHSKKSPTSPIGNDWRRSLLSTLCGSPEIVASILAIFGRRADIGLVMAQHFPPIRGLIHWDGNFTAARKLAGRMGFRPRRGAVLDFPSGSMFWARPAALHSLLDLHLDWEDFPPEQNQVRGTLQHAIERLLLVAVERAGYRWIKVATLSGQVFPETVRPIEDGPALDIFIDHNRLDLSPRILRPA